ncbi:MAG: HNH endonuclease signature motif containing protein [Candidatus Acidiferrales bacterium]
MYKRQCAVTNSHVLHVLDAAHIRPYALGGTHSPTNGLLLRQDVHTLVDRGYLTVTPDYHVEVSHRLKDEFKFRRQTVFAQVRDSHTLYSSDARRRFRLAVTAVRR